MEPFWKKNVDESDDEDDYEECREHPPSVNKWGDKKAHGDAVTCDDREER